MKKIIYNDLYIFTIVAQAGSFAEAGEQLQASHSTIARTISQLEDELGKKVFIRNRTGVTLTSYGEDIYTKTNHVFNNIKLATGDTQSKPCIKILTTDFSAYLWNQELMSLRACRKIVYSLCQPLQHNLNHSNINHRF